MECLECSHLINYQFQIRNKIAKFIKLLLKDFIFRFYSNIEKELG